MGPRDCGAVERLRAGIAILGEGEREREAEGTTTLNLTEAHIFYFSRRVKTIA